MSKSNVSSVSTVNAVGNTSSPPRECDDNDKIKKRIPASKAWCFTLHDYTEKDIEHLNVSFVSMFKELIFSEELGSSGETKHLQGYFQLKKTGRPVELKILPKTAHFEKAKGNLQQNIDYISKEGGNLYINGRKIRKPKILDEDKLYIWEKKLLKLLKTEPDDRTINWYWESEGNSGKSTFTKFLCSKYNAITLSNKCTDMKYGLVKFHEENHYYPDIIIIDIPRSIDLEYLSYTGIEEVKNGCFFSSKYESKQIIMPNPHIVIFSNEEPNYDKMSKDRWHIHHIKKSECTHCVKHNECDENDKFIYTFF